MLPAVVAESTLPDRYPCFPAGIAPLCANIAAPVDTCGSAGVSSVDVSASLIASSPKPRGTRSVSLSLAMLATLAALDADNREDREAVRCVAIPAGMTGPAGVRGDSAGRESAVGSFFSREGTGESGSDAAWGEESEAAEGCGTAGSGETGMGAEEGSGAGTEVEAGMEAEAEAEGGAGIEAERAGVEEAEGAGGREAEAEAESRASSAASAGTPWKENLE